MFRGFLGLMSLNPLQPDAPLFFSHPSVGRSKRLGRGEQQREDLSDPQLSDRQLIQPLAAQRLHPAARSVAGLRGAAVHDDGVFIQHPPPQL